MFELDVAVAVKGKLTPGGRPRGVSARGLRRSFSTSTKRLIGLSLVVPWMRFPAASATHSMTCRLASGKLLKCRNCGTLGEVYLRSFSWVELQHHRGLRVIPLEPL